ncbi:hypothetical protein GF380_01635 [Candidatus Uhrbacteria bacterium]|nr:hypothetical protein [Candidatus Uhrbacteria bacterium]
MRTRSKKPKAKKPAGWRPTMGPMAQALRKQRQRRLPKLPTFSCPVSCQRPCCTDPEMRVELTFFDMLQMATHLQISPYRFYEQYVINDATSVHLPDGTWHTEIWRVRPCLKRPCQFLDANRRCSIYPERPVSCRIFPETGHAVSAEVSEISFEKGNAIVHAVEQYPCLNPDVDLTYASGFAKTMSDETEVSLLSNILTDLIFFGTSPSLFNVREDLERILNLSAGPCYQDESEHQRAQNDLIRARNPKADFITMNAIQRVVRQDASRRAHAQRILKACANPVIIEEILTVSQSWAEQIEPYWQQRGTIFRLHGNRVDVIAFTDCLW